jgi:tRNA A-37 threonylcarbamoyl transferase component Bud32
LDETAAPVGSLPASGAKSTIRYFGDYELDSEIARGGMGVVYKARQVTLNRTVAIKMILAGQLADDLAVDRFHAEAEAAANLKHPNIVAIHEVGQHDGHHYFSMDYIEGRNLAEWAAGEPVSLVKAATLVKTIAQAIHYAHQRGTLHRDLKPSNILIDRDDVPHVTDFGLAKTVDSERNVTRTGDIMGTPNYMSPEQATGRHDRIGPHSDVYALGAILYELVTGEPPFKSANPMDTLLKVIETEPVAPRARRPEIPPDLETICLKCLEKSPQRRYISARELAEDLDRFLRREPIHARPASWVRKASSWTRRHPGALAAAAALVAFGLIASLYYLAADNAFLRAQHADPALTRQAGPRGAALETWTTASVVVSFPAILIISLWSFWRARRRRTDPSHPNQWNQPLRPGLRVAAACLGALAVCVSLIILAKSIDAFVWEGAPGFLDTLHAVYIPGWLGLWLLELVVRDYRLANFGSFEGSTLTTEQKDAIHSKLIHSGRIGAIKFYREFLPAAGLAESKAYVDQLESEWRQRDPQAYAAARKSRALNWRLMAICAGVEAAALLVLWLTVPAVRPMALDFAYGFFIGPFLLAMSRLRGSGWKAIAIVLVTVMVVFFLFGILEYYSPPASNGSQGPFLVGVLFGAALFISACTFKPGKSRHFA